MIDDYSSYQDGNSCARREIYLAILDSRNRIGGVDIKGEILVEINLVA